MNQDVTRAVTRATQRQRDLSPQERHVIARTAARAPSWEALPDWLRVRLSR